MTQVYCYPKLSRAGLGNCLLPWARAVICARQLSAAILAPCWVQPRFGSVLRKERFKRFYLNEFTNRGYIGGLRRALVLATSDRRSEVNREVFDARASGHRHSRTVILFEGLRNYFQDISQHHQ